MLLADFAGEKVPESDQDQLTDQFIHLYHELPSKNDIMLGPDGKSKVMYDGIRWRKLRYERLRKAAEADIS